MQILALTLAPDSSDEPILKITPTGLKVVRDMTAQEWLSALAGWRKVSTLFHSGLADLIDYGQQKWGEKHVDEALEQLEFDLQDSKHAAAILELADGVRNEALTSEHYWVLNNAALTPADQIKWAKIAIEKQLTANQLKKSIAAGKVIEDSGAAGASGRQKGFATFQGLGQQFRLLLPQVIKGKGPVEKWSVEAKREILVEIEEIGKLYDTLKQQLGDE